MMVMISVYNTFIILTIYLTKRFLMAKMWANRQQVYGGMYLTLAGLGGQESKNIQIYS